LKGRMRREVGTAGREQHEPGLVSKCMARSCSAPQGYQSHDLFWWRGPQDSVVTKAHVPGICPDTQHSLPPASVAPPTSPGWLPTKRWQKSLLAGLCGFRAMKANWQSAGHQVEYRIRLRAWAIRST
jgi:hypothetical protein